MNFYDLSGKLKMEVIDLYYVYKILFPNVKVYSYTVNLTKKEVEEIKKYVN